MKHLKKAFYLLLIAITFTNCEKETSIILEEQSIQELDTKTLNDSQNNLGSDMETNIDISNLPQNTANKNSISKIQPSYKTSNGTLTFYSDSEEFDAENCTNLPMEDFEEARVAPSSLKAFNGPLDENTNNDIFIPGEIIEGVFFDTNLQDRPNMVSKDFSEYANQSKRLSANFATHSLLINFTNNDVTSVRMDVFLSYVSGNIEIEIFGNSGLLGSANIFAEFVNGTFFGIKSIEPITQIKFNAPDQINENYVWERIDNLSFGNCDSDGDGVSDENDPYPNSNMSETISIGGNDLNIDNIFTGSGITMMDQIDELIAEINAQYNGDNYAYLHKQFMTKLSSITYYWRKDRLITRSERSAISSAAWSAEIPYFNDPE